MLSKSSGTVSRYWPSCCSAHITNSLRRNRFDIGGQWRYRRFELSRDWRGGFAGVAAPEAGEVGAGVRAVPDPRKSCNTAVMAPRTGKQCLDQAQVVGA